MNSIWTCWVILYDSYVPATGILWIQTQLVVDHNGLDDHRINLYKTNRIKDLLWKLDLKYPR